MNGLKLVHVFLLTAVAVCLPARAEEPAHPAEEPPNAPQAAPSEKAAPSEIEALREDVRRLREELAALQEEVRRLTGLLASTTAQAPPGPAPLPESPPGVPPPALAQPARSQNLLNPAISGVFQLTGASSLSRQDDDNGFDLSEAEVAFQSVVDPYAKVDLFLSFPAGETPEVEEGFATSLALPGSLQLKGGRFKNAIGKWNALHTHAFFTVDRPDALAIFLGEESLTTDGLSASFLVPNPANLYIESISEVGTALEGPAFNSASRSLTYLEHVAGFFSTSADSTLEIGLTGSWGKSGPSQSLQAALADPNVPATLAPAERLDSEILGLDVTYKWKPLQMNVYRSFLWQTEILRSRRDVQVLTPSFTLENDTVTSFGGYTYVESQFTKRWRTGARFDQTGFPDDSRATEWSASAVLRFQPSEFQELRFQLKHLRFDDRAAAILGEDSNDTKLFFEWIPVIGAHGAHKY